MPSSTTSEAGAISWLEATWPLAEPAPWVLRELPAGTDASPGWLHPAAKSVRAVKIAPKKQM